MRIRRDDLDGLGSRLGPPPPPVEPRLTVEEEVALLAGDRRGDPSIHARRERVLRLLRRAATPEGGDAELVALLAAAEALPLEVKDDRLCARQRLAGIGNLDDPPPAVRALLDDLGLMPGDGEAFAERLLPARRDFSGGFDAADASGAAPGV